MLLFIKFFFVIFIKRMEKNPFYWMGISLIATGIFLSFILPLIVYHYPNTKSMIKPLMLAYHVVGLIFGVYITWYIYKHDF